MQFHGEFSDTLIDPDSKDPIVTANTSELQEWLRVHPHFLRFSVVLGSTRQEVEVYKYLKFPNVTDRWV
jgi:hypothetical protein